MDYNTKIKVWISTFMLIQIIKRYSKPSILTYSQSQLLLHIYMNKNPNSKNLNSIIPTFIFFVSFNFPKKW